MGFAIVRSSDDGSGIGQLIGNATRRRLFAAGVDNLLATILCLVIASRLPGDLSSPARWTVAATGYLACFLIQESVWGTTVGKRAFGLLVIRLDGRPARWREAAWRTAFRILEVNPLLLGGIPAGIAISSSKRKQRLGDMLAGTVVVGRGVAAVGPAPPRRDPEAPHE